MSLGRSLLDTAVFIYAVGTDHPLRSPCRRVFEGMLQQEFPAEASVLAVQEVLHQRARRTGDRGAARRFAADLTQVCVLHDVTLDDLRLSLRLWDDAPALDAADAVHAAVAISNGIPVIISPDEAFDQVAGLARISPAAAADRLGQDGAAT
ncbi:MAG TPA: PIN domain-containing protein [Egibacteraceae bacterium]|nr:PIN domain-containing protein [Egibacteraceae bacterium]